MLGIGLHGALEVVHDLERLVAPERDHSQAHPGPDPLGVELQGVEEAGLGLLEPVQVQEGAADGLYHLGVLGGRRQRLLEAGEGLLDQTLPGEDLALL